ncbi:DNA internalization-related competence protein ComEC/Rec2 [Catenovulum sp. 2E275]|uniref:DNA internalization-related competence protein ComEC/Rec2 n=1 Tax=Catenovulum sp. 2E275 TaxID=2980497 RepID=UPI0021CE5417|nr:DNA internalization-related competence protein ComEC/Rec2 [Catenovulum sp. 2E275]MCU4675662.1 DNA internalization-related competence protein ComEC/Rec2 [Catenovulum sp. 2E275]
MEALLLAFIGGNFIANIFPTLLSVNECIVTIGLILILIVLRRYALATGLLGFLIVSLAMIVYTPWTPSYTDVGRDISIIGRVSTLIKNENDQIRFNLKINCLKNVKNRTNSPNLLIVEQCKLANNQDYQALLVPALIRLSWYRPNIELKQGDLLKLKVRLKPVYGLHNQAGFDYQQWLISEKMVATGYIKQLDVMKSDSALRQRLFDFYQIKLSQYQHQDLMMGLILGERGLIPDDKWQVLKQTGTAHLLAVSGLHLGLVFGFFWLIFKLVFRPFALLLKLNLENTSLLCALIFVWLFCFITGFGLAAIRAAIFITAFSMFSLFNWHVRLRFRFLVSSSLVLVIFPLSSLAISFWLSFIAAGLIICLIWWFSWHLKLSSFLLIKQFFILQLLLGLLLIPIQVIFFQHIPLLGIFANLLAIPLISFWVLPVSLICALLLLFLPVANPISELLLKLTDWFLNLLWYWLNGLNEFNHAYFPLSNLTGLGFLLLVLTLIIVIYLMPVKKQSWILISISCISLSYAYFKPVSQQWQLDVLDVGQGLAVLISKDNHAVLYDTGDAYQSGFNLFEAVVEPVLIARQSQLIAVVISHPDKDHAGGLKYIRQYYPHVPVWQGSAECKTFSEQGYLGLNWQFFSTQQLALSGQSTNNDSCVFKVSFAQHSVLLTGDIEAPAETFLTQQYRTDLKADIMLVPHHGSATSSTFDFIAAVSPNWAVNSSGLFNRFSHPNKLVTERYRQFNIPFLNTAQHGQIQFKLSESGIKLSTYADSFLLPWHGKIFKDDL